MVAHPSQLHPVPDDMSDEAAVHRRADRLRGPRRAAPPACRRVTPSSCSAPARSGCSPSPRCAASPPAGTIVAAARYPHQMRAGRATLGADQVCEPGELPRLVRRLTGRLAYGDQLTGGATSCSTASATRTRIAQSLAIVRPRGTVVVVGMPGQVKLDLTTLWHRETQLVGAYAYGTGASRSTATSPGGRSTSPSSWCRRPTSAGWSPTTYPLADYKDAIDHAATAGRRGAVKVAFDLRQEKERNR